MVQLFGSRSGSKDRNSRESNNVAPGTKIGYDPTLVDRLIDDHKEMIAMYQRIQADLDSKHYFDIVDHFANLKRILQDHLLTENVRLYVYISHHLESDEANYELIRDFRREMGKISKTVMEFMRKYTEQPVTSANVEKFRTEFEHIGAVLTERIQREESMLYTLYLSSYD